MLILIALVQLVMPLTKHVDEALLTAYADSTNIPAVVMWAVAWQESRDGKKGNGYIGPGIVRRTIIRTVTVTDSSVDTLVIVRDERVCRERGRMQINPCTWRSKIAARCSAMRIKLYLGDNLYCAGRHLRYLYDRYGSWQKAIEKYNGSGYMARAYRQRALVYIGTLTLDQKLDME